MARFELVDARLHHCGAMARRLRVEHRMALHGTGFDVHGELRARFAESMFCKAWLVDGRLLALGGVTGPQLSAEGLIWFAVSQEALRYPIAMIKEARRQIDGVMVVKRDLTTMILGADDAAKRFAVFLGFRAGGTRQAVSRTGRRHLLRHIEHEPELRIPVGTSFVIPMAFRAEAA